MRSLGNHVCGPKRSFGAFDLDEEQLVLKLNKQDIFSIHFDTWDTEHELERASSFKRPGIVSLILPLAPDISWPLPQPLLFSLLTLSVNRSLHMRVYCHKPCIQIRMLVHHDSGVECCCNEDGVDAARNGCDKDLTDLQTNQESECYNNRREATISVVFGIGEDQVEVSK